MAEIRIAAAPVQTRCRSWEITEAAGTWTLAMKCEDGTVITLADVDLIRQLHEASGVLIKSMEEREAQDEKYAHELNNWLDTALRGRNA